MAKTVNKPMKNAVGQSDGKKSAHASQGQGFARMKTGAGSDLSDRKGRFSGKASDLRTIPGRFQTGLRGVGEAGGQRGAGHASQPSGHKSVVKGMKG